MINELGISALFGMLGGLARFFVASLKTLQTSKISWKGFLLYGLIIILVGTFSGIVLGFGKVISFLGGYVGLDLLDGFYATFKKKQIKVR